MNILQVIPELGAGGAERTTLEVAEAIIAEGGRALVVSEGGRLEDALRGLGGELIKLPVRSKNPLVIHANAGRLARIIADESVDLIHARSRAPAWSALWAARRTGIAFVTTYHGTYNARSGLKRLYNSVMARGDVTIANSDFIADHVRREHGRVLKRLQVIPRGVDLESFDPARHTASEIAAQRLAWDCPPGSPVVLLPARLTRWKGQAVAIAALAQLPPSDPAPVLVLAGDAQGRSAYVTELEAQAGDAGLRVRLVGHLSDMPLALAASDLVLTPSIEPEAFGRTTAEAGAMERLVIAANHGGAREIVEDGITGWLTEAGNPQALAEAIAKALALPDAERNRMQRAARARVIERFSTRALQQNTLRVYREVLDYQP